MDLQSEIAVVIPTVNEEKGIGDTIDKFPSEVRDRNVDIFVIDGNSTDNTIDVAERHGATVIEQTYDGGKGAALQESFDRIDANIYVTIDGDDTYPADQLDKLLEPIFEGQAHHVIGCRKILESGSMDTLNYIGNIMFSKMASVLHSEYDAEDILSGYRAITEEKLDEFNIKSQGFDVETELTMLSMANGGVVNVEMSYFSRKGETKLNPFMDGMAVLMRMIEVRTRTLLFGYSRVDR